MALKALYANNNIYVEQCCSNFRGVPSYQLDIITSTEENV